MPSRNASFVDQGGTVVVVIVEFGKVSRRHFVKEAGGDEYETTLEIPESELHRLSIPRHSSRLVVTDIGCCVLSTPSGMP